MNKHQQKVLLGTAALVTLMTLYPPFIANGMNGFSTGYGYDWIFSYDISGLITKYGGANSHMAIRSAELNLAASIGVGSIIFNEILNASKIYLNCENKSIKIIE